MAQLVKQHKQAFLDRLISTAVEAGAPDPVSLGRQLAVVYEGAAALSASFNTTQVVPDASRRGDAHPGRPKPALTNAVRTAGRFPVRAHAFANAWVRQRCAALRLGGLCPGSGGGTGQFEVLGIAP